MKKTETKKFNRQLKKAEQKGEQKGKEKAEKVLLEILKLIPLSQQVIDYTKAGMDVTIHAEISSKKLLEILEAK